MTYQILMAVSQEETAALLTLHLSGAEMLMRRAKGWEEALELAESEPFSAAVVDLELPERSGWLLIRRLRSRSNLPILAIMPDGTEEDMVLALDMGADACLLNGIRPLEVRAYLRALCRRYYQLGSKEDRSGIAERLRVGELELDLNRYELRKRGRTVPMTSVEMKVMAKLMRSPGQVFTKEQLYQCINGDYCRGDEKTIMVHVCNIRNKLEDEPARPQYIRTVRGLGYKLENA